MSKELNFLKWSKVQGVDTISFNKVRTYLKNDSSVEAAPKAFVKTGARLHDVFLKDASGMARQIASACDTLESLREAVQKFDGCLLKKTATNTVFADGNAKAKVMLIGEAPGMNEDLQGIPFCGESGKLLDKVLRSIGLERSASLYITNSVFWRPPGNRKPTDEEIKCCLPFVEKHIALIKPVLIIIAGAVALQTLFGVAGSVTKLRQRIQPYKNDYMNEPVATTVIFHPSYLLRQPSQKKLAWHDMLFIKSFLESHA